MRIPLPPSVVALPPMPSEIRRAPASRAARSSSPVPTVVGADRVQLGPAPASDRPDASASSTTARSPSSERSQAGGDRPAERVAGRAPSRAPSHRPPRSRPACPSPPSASGASRSSSSGPGAGPALGERAGDLDRRQRALERVRGEDDRQPTVGSRRRSPQVLPEPGRRRERPVGQQRVVRDRAGLVPARWTGRTSRPPLPVSVSSTSSQRPSAAGDGLGRRHQRRGDPAPASRAMDDDLGDLCPMWRVRVPGPDQQHRARPPARRRVRRTG